MTFVLATPQAPRLTGARALRPSPARERRGATPAAAVSVLVADDNAVYRGGVVRALVRRSVDVVAEVGDGAEALDAIRRLRPQVALLDLRMPHLDGIGVAEQVRADPALAQVRVLILTAEEREAAIERARAAGAVGYLDKNATRRDICDAVIAAADPAAR